MRFYQMRSKNIAEFIKAFPSIQENIPLKNHTGYRIGGSARFFLVAKKPEDIITAITIAQKNKINFEVIGGGYNLLVSDKGYDGLAIKMQITDYRVTENKGGCEINCGSGTCLSTIVKETTERGLTGFEWASGIPGTIGGSIYGNAAAFRGTMADCVSDVTVFDSKALRVDSLCEQNDFCFKYRSSRFKKNKNLIILSATLKFKYGDKEKIKDEVRHHLEYRKKNHPLEYPSAGSVFKNFEINSKKNIKIADTFFRTNPKFDFFKGKGFIPAGMVIESCGLRGKQIGGAQISEKHANFIVNKHDASANDILALIRIVKTQALKKAGILVNEEIQYLGFKKS
ncbi:MAG: UDP-N-acetylmuramate dehydrogenase [bacterium]